MRSPIGIRIRRRRAALGLTQVELARALGISASYLNLIENNKRAIAGSLLLRISERLGIDLALLSGDREARAIAAIHQMLSDPLFGGIELSDGEIRELVGRFPEAGLALARLYRAHLDAKTEIESLVHRIRSDPLLSELLHQMLNRIAGIKSGAEILAGIPDLTEEERSRFHATINAEARELAATGQNLVQHFDRSLARRRPLSPLAELDEAIIASGNHFPALEDVAEALRHEIGVGPEEVLETGPLIEALQKFSITCRRMPFQRGQRRVEFDPEARLLWHSTLVPAPTLRFQLARLYAQQAAADAISGIADTMELAMEESRQMAYGALSSYVAGAMMMPYRQFLAEAEAQQYDVDLLAYRHGASFEQAAHRLVTLRRPGEEGVPFGFLRADPTGRLTKRFPLPGLVLPITGHGCMLWPLYDAFGQKGIIRQLCEFPGGAKFLLVAKAEAKGVLAHGIQPRIYSIMLACDLLQADRIIYGKGIDLRHEAVPVGPSCLLCPRQDCNYRQENSA